MGTPSIKQAGATVVLLTIATKVVGFVREMIVAAHYGTTQAVDIYLAGIAVPILIGTILQQALPNAFIPWFSRDGNGEPSRKRLGLSLIALTGLSAAALWVLAKPIASLTSSGFSPDLRSETVVILRIASAAVVIATIEALFRSRLLAHKRFVYSGFSGVWTSLVMIVAIIAYPEGGARTLVWGFIAGSLLAAIWNLAPYAVRRERPAPGAVSASGRPPLVSDGFWLTMVIFLGGAGMLYMVLDRYLASFLTEGSIAALQYANLLASQPVAVIGIAIGTAIFPFLSQNAVEGNVQAAGHILNRAIRLVLIGSVPIAVWLGVLGHEITAIAFERGAFGSSSRTATGMLLVPYAFWVVPAVLAPIVIRVFYSTLRWRPILAAVLAGLVVKVVLSLWFVREFGAAGLAGGTAVSALSTIFILLSALPPEMTRGRRLGWAQLFVTIAGACLFGAVLGYYLPNILGIGEWRAIAVARVAAGVALSVVLGTMCGTFFHIDEFYELRHWVAERFFGR